MDGALKRIFKISSPQDLCVPKLQKYCRGSSKLLKIPVISKPLCISADCHNNVNKYVNTYGGERVIGYYLITDIDDENYGCAIYHSIWKNTYGNLIDITPFEDSREYNMFCEFNGENYYSGVVFNNGKYEVLNPGLNVM
jgi:hypothetical protein